jgi:putative transposon-encoded protein
MPKHRRALNVSRDGFYLYDHYIEKIYESEVKKCGNGAHVSIPKAYVGKKAYIVIRDTESPVD